jgi:hypothetical protein
MQAAAPPAEAPTNKTDDAQPARRSELIRTDRDRVLDQGVIRRIGTRPGMTFSARSPWAL